MTITTSERRFPVEPIRELEGVGLRTLAGRLGMSDSKLYRHIRQGGWTFDLADSYAIRLGYMPEEVWPDFLDLDDDELGDDDEPADDQHG